MKRLAILRHAKSKWNDEDLADIERPLNARGREASTRIGAELKGREFRFDLVIASPAARVRETISELRKNFDLAAPVRFEADLYLADCDLLLKVVRGLPDSIRQPLMVGHNPGLHQFLLALIKDHDQPFARRIAHNLPTAAFALVELEAEHWQEVRPATGTLTELLLPKQLD